MPPHRSELPPPPQPTRVFFDPFNSSSTGHQRAENRLSGSTSWRDSRLYKLQHQFKDSSGRGGNQHLSDLVGAGSENFNKDGRKDNGDWEAGAPGLRGEGWQDIRGILGGSKKRSSGSLEDNEPESRRRRADLEQTQPNTQAKASRPSDYPATPRLQQSQQLESSSGSAPHLPQIFRNLTIYLNGSTAPLVSDHKLKQLFAQHGGGASIALGRRSVTHVIIGAKCGGGLASSKIQKEISTVSGKGIKYVTAQWVLDSVEKGIRQPEARYAPQSLSKKIGGSGQGSVRNMFQQKTTMNNGDAT